MITLEGGEVAKTLPVLRRLWKKLWQYRVDRGQVILLIGGGSILDVGGFAAATWKRGIPFISIPTTLIAQIDAALGGKVGINFRQGKNLIGTFAEAQAVWVWPDFLKTLPPRERRAGWIEALKHSLLHSETLWAQVYQTSFDAVPSVEMLRTLASVKVHIVAQDPYEKLGLRQALNLGHTLGHVWEALSHRTETPLLHGEAVAIGLVQELWVSMQRGHLSQSLWQALITKLRQEKMLLPLPPFTWRQWEAILFQDKKRREGQLYLPLLTGIGKWELTPVQPSELQSAVKAYKNLFPA